MNSGLTKFQNILLVLLLSTSSFFVGLNFGKRGYIFEVKKNPPKIEIINRTSPAQTVDFKLFWDVWDLVASRYLERPVDAKKMLYGAIQGAVRALGDPYTSFLPPEQSKAVDDALNGTYEGIGAELGTKDDRLIVIAPLDGSPAKKAGLRSGDIILEIDGQSTAGITLTEAVSKIRGPAGTVVSLAIERENSVLRIKRGEVTIESVSWEDKGDGVVYIRISRFGTDTNETWTKVVSEANVKMREMNAIVLDVRGNPGGYLSPSVFIAGEFFSGKPVLYEETATGKLEEFKTDRMGSFVRIPVFVLIDGGSASASEILAAALKVNAKATLIGEKSFGKGTIQDSRKFSDGSGLHITIAKWLTPDKTWIHDVGIKPDIIVERTEEEAASKIDRQLEKALELARNGG